MNGWTENLYDVETQSILFLFSNFASAFILSDILSQVDCHYRKFVFIYLRF